MFTTAIAAAVLASSIAMPPMIDNDWAGPKNDWAPLTAAYTACAEHSVSSFSYFVCTNKAYNIATSNIRKA